MYSMKAQVALLILLMFAVRSIVNAQQTKHSMPMHHSSKMASQTAATYSCPMHPEVVSDKPGTCPKCGMTLVKNEPNQGGKTKASAAASLQEARKLLAAAKSQLTREGKYDCCIEDACNECALDEQECSCHKDLKKGEAVCNECWTGWQRGEGKDKSVDPKSVKTSFTDHDHD